MLVFLLLDSWASTLVTVFDFKFSFFGGEEPLGPAFFSEVDKGMVVVFTALAFVMVSPDKDAWSSTAKGVFV